MNDGARAHQVCEKLESIVEACLKLSLSEEMKNAILGCNPYSEKVVGKRIKLIEANWETISVMGLISNSQYQVLFNLKLSTFYG